MRHYFHYIAANYSDIYSSLERPIFSGNIKSIYHFIDNDVLTLNLYQEYYDFMITRLGRDSTSVSRVKIIFTQHYSICTHRFPCSFLYDPPYLLLVPKMSAISGMKLANMACRWQHMSTDYSSAVKNLLTI